MTGQCFFLLLSSVILTGFREGIEPSMPDPSFSGHSTIGGYKQHGDRFVFFHAPGFDDTFKSEKEGPAAIFSWIRNVLLLLNLFGGKSD
jgi:hypothetical protein